jgi:hypothetical protein
VGGQAAGIMTEFLGEFTTLSILAFCPLLITLTALFCRETGWRARGDRHQE